MTDKHVPPATEEKLAEQEIARQALEEKTKLAQDYYDQLLRSRAEFDNYRKRVEKEKAQMKLWGEQEVLMHVIGLHDMLVHGKSQAANKPEAIMQGLELICQDFQKFLKSQGIQSVPTVGQSFDPQVHEALERIETEDQDDGTILEELQSGYTLDGQLLRPARVKVAARKIK